jgi:hypothetical protein
MRKKALMFASVVLFTMTLCSSAGLAAPTPEAEMRTARAEAGALPPVTTAGTAVNLDALRDCAALVLVGGMLIGLAAAVRRAA